MEATPSFEGHTWPRKPLWGYVNEANPAQMYTLSAVCVSGSEVSLYSFDKEAGVFRLKRDGAGNALVQNVNALGIYLQEVDLQKETNNLLLRCEYGEGNYQHVRLDITLLDQGLLDSIRGFAANFRSIFGGW